MAKNSLLPLTLGHIQLFVLLFVSIHNVFTSELDSKNDVEFMEHLTKEDFPGIMVDKLKNVERDAGNTVILETGNEAEDSEAARGFKVGQIATNSAEYWVQTRWHTFLAESSKGRIYGSPQNSSNTRFRLLVYTTKVVRLQNIQSQNYLAISCQTGKVYVTNQLTEESLLERHTTSNAWETFRSRRCTGSGNNGSRSRAWYLAIRKNGKYKNAKMATSNYKGATFLLAPA